VNQGERAGLREPDGHAVSNTLSLIRTITVGSGITPDLLTSATAERSRAGSTGRAQKLHHRRWGVAPRPENDAASGRRGGAQYREHLARGQSPI